MAHKHLEVRTPDGEALRRRLSRRNPIVVGRNPISDVHVDDTEVAPIHCRVSWNGKAFEVAAVSDEGVDVNGVLVRRKELTAGDVIRVGSVDLVMLNGSGETTTASPTSTVADKKKRKRDPSKPSPPEPALADEAALPMADDEWRALAAGEIEMPVMQPRPPAQAVPQDRGPQAVETADEKADEEADESADEPDDVPVLLDEAAAPAPTTKPVEEPPPAAKTRAWNRLAPAKRPGEQDIITSPLVLGFGGLALILLLAGGAIWLLISREGSDRLFNAAEADREAGRYAQAIRGYEQFLFEYPGDRRGLDAQYALGLTRIERHVGGSSPDFSQAIAEFDEFVRSNRDAPRFEELREPLREIARRISSGAAAAAVRTGDRQLLAPAEEGQRLFVRYSPSDGSSDASRQALEKEYARAEVAVQKREYFDNAAAKIEAAIANNDFATAFGTRFDLLTRYPDLRSDRRVRTLLARSLESEQRLIRELEPQAQTSGESLPAATAAVNAVTIVGHTQARAGEVSDGRLVFAVVRNALVGVDAVTGRPQWRRAIGLDTPFFPVAVDVSVPALIVFDATRHELALLERSTGEPIWRVPISTDATGPPLVTQGQIDLATADGRLIRFDLETGSPLAAVSFPQPLLGPPVLAREGERLIAFGAEATAYTLDLRTLEPQSVSLTGHAAGSLDTPAQALGRLIVVCENDRLDSAAIRAFAIDPESGALQQVASERIPGQVRQSPVARGNLLFVSSSPERITAFSVSDDPGQPPLTRLSGIQIPDPQDVKTFLVPGPDGMLWAASSALRKLRLAADGIELLPGGLASGRHSQPPQEAGESLFVARTLPSAAAIYVSRADREAMTGSWRTVLGAQTIAFAANEHDATIATEAGLVANVSESDFDKSRFVDARPLPQWDDASPEPIHGARFHDGRVAAWRGGKTPLLWFITAGEQPPTPRRLEAGLECAPIALDGGLVLPLPGRLAWLPQGTGGMPVEDFLLPVSGDGNTAGPRWQSLVRIDAERFAACDEAGLLRVLRVRREPLPHLDEVASLALDSAPSSPLASIGERVVVLFADQVRLFDPAGLRPVAEAAREDLSGGPWTSDKSDKIVFVEAGGQSLLALDGETLEERWQATLGGPVASRPLRTADGWLVASQNGDVLDLADDGSERRRIELGEPLTGLETIGKKIIALTLDGSLLSVDSSGDEKSEQPSRPDAPEPAGAGQEAVQ